MRTGIWLIGAHGDIATTLIIGTLAIRHGLSSTQGMVTSQAPFNMLQLPELDGFVFGGCETRKGTLTNRARRLADHSHTVTDELLKHLGRKLETIDEQILIDPDLDWTATKSRDLSSILNQMRRQLRSFANDHHLDHVVVVNLSSAEPMPELSEQHQTLSGIEALIATNRKDLMMPSMGAAYAAFSEGCAYINFTSGTGAAIAGLQELAKKNGCPHYGNDGKTGETLLKTVLAPMFMARNLEIMSWEGVNLLGNEDGRTLSDPARREGKIHNKDRILRKILDYTPHSGVTINYVPSLGDWKTAWDLIHFRGFLDTAMSLQFTWQGCDSILAAPLILDMVRLCAFAAQNGESGLQTHLACFFKNPIGNNEMAFAPQYQQLLDYAKSHLPHHTDQK